LCLPELSIQASTCPDFTFILSPTKSFDSVPDTLGTTAFGAFMALILIPACTISGYRIKAAMATIANNMKSTREIPHFSSHDGGLDIMSCKSSVWISSDLLFFFIPIFLIAKLQLILNQAIIFAFQL